MPMKEKKSMKAHTVTFDTLQFSKRLTEAGMQPKLSEELTEVIADVLQDGDFVTKSHFDLTMSHFDLTLSHFDNKITLLDNKISLIENKMSLVENKINDLETKMDGKLNDLETKMDGKLNNLEARIDGKLGLLEARLIRWMVGLFLTNTTMIGAFIAISQFLSHAAK